MRQAVNDAILNNLAIFDPPEIARSIHDRRCTVRYNGLPARRGRKRIRNVTITRAGCTPAVKALTGLGKPQLVNILLYHLAIDEADGDHTVRQGIEDAILV